MTDPISFASATPRLGLPQLFAAQAQKEFIVNESLSRLDMLLHCAVEGEADEPPAAPMAGEAWIIGDSPTGDWAGHAGELAGRQAQAWVFVAPREGVRVFDRAARQIVYWDGGWQRPQATTAPTGGATVDAEARAAIGNLIESLRAAGIFGTP
ncbi:DUF2793 domain-containing protein [Pelagerythrobacter sp.]|uniref:DUF2793 domain-containing protein n=1 Tax=Pelagerythrobacter sp. TaxID=2800702 RepID=UPI0035B0C913